MAKSALSFVCQNCGAAYNRWQGKCESCGEWNTLVEEDVTGATTMPVSIRSKRKGRLFDYIEGAEGFDKFIFPSPYGEIVTKSVLDIDEPLIATFATRVRELGHLQPVERLARIA